MTDYYSYKPLITLDKPLVLTGFLGARVDEVARNISRLTGLKLLDLGRSIEHEAGRSIARLVVEDGEWALRVHERAILERTELAGRSLVLPLLDHTLTLPHHRDRLLAETRVVYLRQTLEEMKASIARQLKERSAAHYAFLLGTMPDDKQLVELFEKREPGYLAAPEVVDIGTRSPRRTAQLLLERLELQ